MVNTVIMNKQIDGASTETKVGTSKTVAWDLRLYVAGETTKSIAAISNLKRLCEEHLPDIHRIEVIDLVKHPELARSEQIVALPTLVRKLPPPIRKLIGNLSSDERVLKGLEIALIEHDSQSVLDSIGVLL
jgi:circadian clock protein KaiB